MPETRTRLSKTGMGGPSHIIRLLTAIAGSLPLKRSKNGFTGATFIVTLLLVLVIGSALPRFAQSQTKEAWPKQIVVGSFVKGSSQYPAMVGAATLIRKYTPADAIVREFPGGTAIWEALMRHNVDTWAQAFGDMAQAYYGTGFWEGKPQDVAVLTALWNFDQDSFGVRPGSGIKSIKDLAGKRCLVMSNIPDQNKVVEAILKHAGVWDKATLLKWGSIADIAPAVIDRKVDCWFATVLAAYVEEIRTAAGVNWIPLTPEEQEVGLKASNGVTPADVPNPERYGYPAGTVIRAIGLPVQIYVRADMPEHVAYGILKAWYDGKNLDEVRPLSPSMGVASIQNACKMFWSPVHPGAVQYYKDRGVWTSETEQRQKKLLSAPRNFGKK